MMNSRLQTKTQGDDIIGSNQFSTSPVKEQHRIVAKIEELLPYCDRLVNTNAKA